MKKFLLTVLVGLLAFIPAMKAQEFNASDWVLNAQSFNKVDGEPVSNLTAGDKSLEVTFPATAASTLGRLELSSTADITMGAGNNVVVMKVDFINCSFQDFDANSFSILRQLYNGSDNKGVKNDPFFNTDANKAAGRMSNPINTATATTAYYWRDMTALATDIDWTKEFTIYGDKFTNKKFTVDGSEMYGRCWLGVRFAHSTKNTTIIPDNASIKISYIGVTSLEKLGVENTADLKGTHVRTYIEDILKGGPTTGIEDLTDSSKLSLNINGNTISADNADQIEVYTMTGVKVGESDGNAINAEAGFYIVRVTGDNKISTHKIAIK